MIHLNEICVEQGDPVFQGQIIGEIGRTGNASSVVEVPNSHVHITIRNRRIDGVWVYETVPSCYMSSFFDPINNWAPDPCIND